MRKLITLLFALILCNSFAFADSCPTVKDIKANQTQGWTAFDSADGKAFAPDKLQALANAIHEFALAEYVTEGPSNGAIHCYYRDKHGSDLEAYFSKEHISLSEKNEPWYEVTGFMHCAAGADKCTFGEPKATPNSLAKNTVLPATQKATPAS